MHAVGQAARYANGLPLLRGVLCFSKHRIVSNPVLEIFKLSVNFYQRFYRVSCDSTHHALGVKGHDKIAVAINRDNTTA